MAGGRGRGVGSLGLWKILGACCVGMVEACACFLVCLLAGAGCRCEGVASTYVGLPWWGDK